MERKGKVTQIWATHGDGSSKFFGDRDFAILPSESLRPTTDSGALLVPNARLLNK